MKLAVLVGSGTCGSAALMRLKSASIVWITSEKISSFDEKYV